MDIEAITGLLQKPSEGSKGWTRWWWFGPSVTEEEIALELNYMHDAGIGGVEVAVLYPLVPDQPSHSDTPGTSEKNLDYFSPEFFQVLKFAANTAHSLGMGFDFTLGSSWPYGGPFITDDLASSFVIPYQIDLKGPMNYSHDFTNEVIGKIFCAVLGRMKDCRMIPESVTDVTGSLASRELYGWPWGVSVRNLSIPASEWKLVLFSRSTYHQQLGIPAKGAGGYAMDHCRADAMEKFLRNEAEPLSERLPKRTIDGVFCDSIELDGTNWTDILPSEFEKRRGYSIIPYLYGLFGSLGNDDLTGRVRYDYFLTMSELTLENFFQPLTRWAHTHGMKSRIQAHGTWADILQAYAAADIPEGESFGPQDLLKVNVVQRRLAASAGHLYERQIISNESFTWLRVPRYMETLENIKAAADAIFLDGINAIINHGYAYSPDDSEGLIGRTFYASSQINHKNTYWDCYPEFGRYVQRVAGQLQVGNCVAEVAIYIPQADIWSNASMGDIHDALKIQDYLGWDFTDAVNKAGYYYDFINDDCMHKLYAADNNVEPDDDNNELQQNINRQKKYKILIVPYCTRVPEDSAKAFINFAAAGGLLVFVDTIPVKSCGLLKARERDEEIQKIVGNLPQTIWNLPDTWVNYQKGKVIHSSRNIDIFLNNLREAAKPDLDLGSCRDTVGYIHRQVDNVDLYFIANISKDKKHVSADFGAYRNTIPGTAIASGIRPQLSCNLPSHSRKIAVYEAMTGSEYSAWTKTSAGIEFDILPYGSIFVYIYDASNVNESCIKKTNLQFASSLLCDTAPISLSGVWELNIPEKNFHRIMSEPVTWERFEELRYFSGLGTYIFTFDLLESDYLQIQKAESTKRHVWLTLDSIFDNARIKINGQWAGMLWKHPYELEISGLLQSGENTIEFCCGNRLINYALDPGHEPRKIEGIVIDEWPYFTDVINDIRQKRMGYAKERTSISEPVPSGMEGSVQIKVEE